MSTGREVRTREQVMDGFAEPMSDVQVETTFPAEASSSRCTRPSGSAPELGRAAGGPDGRHRDLGTGAYRIAPGEIELNADRAPDERGELTFTNTADRPIQVGSHVHLPDVNAGLELDRVAAQGFRLDIAAGTSVRFEPGASRTVATVDVAGTVAYHGRGEPSAWHVRCELGAGLTYVGQPFVVGDGADVTRTLDVELAPDAR